MSGFERGVILGYQFLKFQAVLKATSGDSNPIQEPSNGGEQTWRSSCVAILIPLTKSHPYKTKTFPPKKRTRLGFLRDIYGFLGDPQAANFPRQLFFGKLLQPPPSCRTRLKISKVSLDGRPRSCDKLKNRFWTCGCKKTPAQHGFFFCHPKCLTSYCSP